ncbi:Nucleoporin p58/p45 [Balamuthia mandrillaris]
MAATGWNLQPGALFQTSAQQTATATNAPAAITYSTPFADLPANMKQELIKIQTYIVQENSISEEIAQHSPELISKAVEEIHILQEKLKTLENTLQSDKHTINVLRKEVGNELKNAELAVRTMERLTPGAAPSTLHQQFHLPSRYFWEVANSFEKRMHYYRQTIDEIEHYLSSSSGHRTYTPQTLQEIMRNQYAFFMAISARLASLHNQVAQHKERFVQMRGELLGDYASVEKLFENKEDRKSEEKVKYVPSLTQAAAASTPSTTTTATPSTTTTSSLFSTPSTTTSSSLFGGTPSTTSTSSSLFGTPSTTSSTTSLFGTPSTTTSTTSSLFGAPSSTSTSTTPSSSSSLFGSSIFNSSKGPITSGLGLSTAGTATFGATSTTSTPASSSAFTFGRK